MIRFAAAFAFAIALGVVSAPARADSPLTSTDLSSAYADVPEVAHVREGNGLDARIEAYLLDPRTPPDRAVAVIHALGWQFEGQDNHIALLRRLLREDPKRFDDFRRGRGDAQLLLVIGFAWALDDYHDPRLAEALLREAARRQPDSFAAAFAHALVRAQLDMDDGNGGWCRVYRGPHDTISRWASRPRDLRDGSVDAAMRYLDGYREYCG